MTQGAPDDVGSVRALLFDLGGVVIELDFKQAFRVWAERASRDPAELGGRFGFDEAYKQHERGDLDAAAYFTALRRNLGLRLSDDDIVSGWNDIHIAPVPGMAALLSAASQRFPVYAFTNSNPTHKRVWAGRFAKELSIFRRSLTFSKLVRRVHSFRATSGPVIRLRSGNVEAMIASEAASPPRTVAQYAIPGILNAMSTCEWR
jgi:putative hydrolase of the HAD superfamily